MDKYGKIVVNSFEAKKETSAFQKHKTIFSQSPNSPIDHILYLQRAIGNQALQWVMTSGVIQAKLAINRPGDKYEQEADRIADQVMRMSDPQVQRQVDEEEEEDELVQPKPLAAQITPLIQCQTDEPEEEEEEPIQTKQASGQRPFYAIKDGGRPLPASVRAYFEPRFKYDFSQVRVHTDIKAAESARIVNARAFTIGQDVVFGAGQYEPGTADGRKLISHELVHVMQQKSLLQRQRKNSNQPAPAATHFTTPWDKQEKEARAVLQHSFNTRQPKEWIWNWKQGSSAADCFNRLSREYQQAFQDVYHALKAERLWSEIQRVIDFWPRSVRGMRFTLSDPKRLMAQLISNARFCYDTRLGGSQHSGVTWRQVVTAGTEGLHVSVSISGSSSAHLDTIAPVAGREPDGECRYSMRHILPHVSRELWGWRNLELFPPTKPRKGEVQPWLRVYIPGT